MRNWLNRFLGDSGAQHDRIVSAISPWMLACAVGAENGSSGFRHGFDLWLRCSRDNWMPETRAALGDVSERQIEAALRKFVAENRHKSTRTVYDEALVKRGRPPSGGLGRGKSMTLTKTVTRTPAKRKAPTP